MSENLNRSRLLYIGASLAATLGGSGLAAVERSRPRPRLATPMRISSTSPNSMNGGQRRKRAIRAVRLRKSGRVRFGKFVR